MRKSFRVRDGDLITLEALPVTISFPAIDLTQVQTGVKITVNGEEKQTNTPIDIKYGDTFVFEFVQQPAPTITVNGSEIFTAFLDGASEYVSPDGIVKFEFVARNNDHFVQMAGEQAQPYTLTFNNSGSSVIKANGIVQEDGATLRTNKDTHIEAAAIPIPVHFVVNGNANVQVNGVEQSANDFTIDVNASTEIDIDAGLCTLTIDYGDNSYTIQVPKEIITICAAHRDYWLFDCWSSPDVGITSPKMVRTQVDLRNHDTATLVCHYQKFYAKNKPGFWN